MAVILNNYANHFGLTLPSIRTGTFNDAAQFSSWAEDAINVMYEAGVVSGVGNNTFNPQAGGTRAEVATMLRNFMEATRTGPFGSDTDPAMLRDEDLYYDRREEEDLEQDFEPSDSDDF